MAEKQISGMLKKNSTERCHFRMGWFSECRCSLCEVGVFHIGV